MLIKKSGPLKGQIFIPGDKSISHRAIMLGSIAEGTTRINGFLSGVDCLSTISCFRKMGVEISQYQDQNRDQNHNQNHEQVLVHGRGLHGLQKPDSLLDCGNSGTSARLIAGILAGQSFESVLTGDASLLKRPMGRIMDPLTCMGADIRSLSAPACLPLAIRPARLHGIDYRTKVASGQVKSCILLAGLYADGATSVTEPALSRNHTEIMLRYFGADISCTGLTASIRPGKALQGRRVQIPGDISSAAYFIAAGLLVPGSEILIRNVGINPTRSGILRVCKAMRADITYTNLSSGASLMQGCSTGLLNSQGTGLPQSQCADLPHNQNPDLLQKQNSGLLREEPCADILVRHSHLHGVEISGDIIPSLIDEIPVIAVLAAAAQGTTVIRDAAELKVKESNRIRTIALGLRALGIDVTQTDDGLIIEGNGGKPFTGQNTKSCAAGEAVSCSSKTDPIVIDSFCDHRIAMSFAVASLITEGETEILHAECASISYPGFYEDLRSLST